MKVPLLNFVGGPGVPLLNFEGGPGVPLLNFEGVSSSEVPGPGVLVPLLHHACEVLFKNQHVLLKTCKQVTFL